MSNPMRKTLTYLGLMDEDTYREPHPTYVTPARKAAAKFATQQETFNENQIVTVHPEKYSDAAAIADNFRLNIPVILNIKHLNREESLRLIDFCSGLVTGLNGKIEKVTSKVFLLTPYNVATSITGEPNLTG